MEKIKFAYKPAEYSEVLQHGGKWSAEARGRVKQAHDAGKTVAEMFPNLKKTGSNASRNARIGIKSVVGNRIIKGGKSTKKGLTVNYDNGLAEKYDKNGKFKSYDLSEVIRRANKKGAGAGAGIKAKKKKKDSGKANNKRGADSSKTYKTESGGTVRSDTFLEHPQEKKKSLKDILKKKKKK